ncbi:Hcp family type VI secretion system effector [Pseudomonas syringae pv. actinidiae]|uniref:Type VI protein secretion system component Hcp n=1 Tax=Pseudomonas syringae pv. actinidiae TaxID=103796 RepID=A0A2V0QKN0_PSESF|nr:Hcp family type VI secretion system effector [Pseudomonas syringae]EPN16471.1 secreted protein Hcp [Pseudomonas syringae pv. actinidiae ICMP 19070]MDU8491843.1 Hcp family type VI secretion system effector [Pseudomonas syringae pv. actinidiae]NVL27322.1 Hcp family type VI secretion system effector [Pseudomonas syringae pv. actinidiae]NVL30371.1 Hcp family type VI secretion system effector [Pseudomonas syringae pv. actinidiae]NVL36586.1 Hcp family type VI secretion system effector [Pseudomona
MPTPAYLTVTGAIQGNITKDADSIDSLAGLGQAAHLDESIIYAFSHEITSPYNLQSGSSAGPHIHHPICITKAFDKASPLLLQALTHGEMLSEVIINWYRTNDNKQEHYYTTRLERAKIVAIKDHMPNSQDPQNSNFTHLQDVHFSYRKITWSHVTSKSMGSDDWDKPKMD